MVETEERKIKDREDAAHEVEEKYAKEGKTHHKKEHDTKPEKKAEKK